MKKFLFCLLFIIFTLVNITPSNASAINMQWYNEDGTIYDTTTCNVGDDIILPTTPTKRGYTFMGWTGYTPIEYLESTGTQYINTGISAQSYNANLIIESEFAFTNISQGALVGTQTQSGFVCLPLYISEGAFKVHIGGHSADGQPVTLVNADTNKHHIVVNFVNKTIYFDNDEFGPISTLSTINALIYLFAQKNANDAAASMKASVKIYNISFRQRDGTYIRDFVPVLDSDGVACMYDRISGKYFYNNGTGSFVAGAVVSE